MKKTLIVLCILLFLCPFLSPHIKASQNIDNELLKDAFITTLAPYINKEIVQYYGETKQHGLYDVKIMELSRTRERQFRFFVKVVVKTFEHAHAPPFGTETMTFEIDPAGIKSLSFTHQGDEEEKKIDHFYEETIKDIQDSFHLNLVLYTPYRLTQLQYKAESENEYKSLTVIAESIKENILNPTIHAPYKNVIDPVTYIKGDRGYILFKQADGTNTIYTIEKRNHQWNVTKKENRKGKKMKKELIWYM